MILSFPCVVTDVFERKFSKHHKGAGPLAILSSHSAGWYIQIDGAFSIYVGEEKPEFVIDQAVVLSIRPPTESP